MIHPVLVKTWFPYFKIIGTNFIMKITFKSSKLQEGTVKISFDGGNEFREYELAEVKDTGISLSDSQDLDKIKIKGPANILKNLEVISDIKLDSEGKQSPTIKNETEHYYAWVEEEFGWEEGDNVHYCIMTKTLVANDITNLYILSKEKMFEDTDPIIRDMGSLQALGVLDIHRVDDNKIVITTSNETLQLVRFPSKDIDYTKTTITSLSFVMDNDLGKFPYNVTGVIVPEGVTDIRGAYDYNVESVYDITNKSAFSIYPNLKAISLPSSIKSIGYRSFAGCHGFSINIPDGTDVSDKSFSGSTPIEIIANQEILGSIGSLQHEYICNVYTIGDYAYQNCTKLIEVDISQQFSNECTIDKYAFHNCTNLKKVTTSFVGSGSDSDNVLDIPCIGRSAFEDCKSLESFDSLKGVEQIDDYAFLGCENLEITIPEGLTKIGERAFDGCKCVYLTMSSFNDKPDISQGFYGCNNVGVNISDNLTEIPDCAFEYYSRLKSVVIPESVNKIGEGAFSGCEDLTYVEIPENVTQIGKAAFKNCASLTNITIPGNITEICSSTFQNCTNLEEVTIPESVTHIGNYALQNCTNLTELEIPENVTEIGDYAFDGCTGLTNINLPDNLTKISPYTFRNCTNLTDVYVPESTTEIGESAYEGCTKLTSITIPCVTSIGQTAFQGCTSLTSIDIPDGVTSIGEYVFNGCTNLTGIILPDSVTSIDESSFGGCTNLATINYMGTQEQWDAIEKPKDWNSACPNVEIVYEYTLAM